MKKNLLLILTLALFSINKISAQSYIMQASTSGQTHVTCQGFIQNTLCSYGFFPFNYTAYCQGIDRWEAFTNGGTGPIRINLTSLALNTGDQVRIYNGVGTGGTLLATYINTVTSLGNFVTAASGTITVRFTTNSDGNTGDGFTAIIGCLPTGCGGNNPAADTCLTATRICDASPYCGNTGGWYTADKENIDATGSGIFCGSIENNSWIVFTANTTSASFKVDVANCADASSGIQMQMYATNCSTFSAVSSCINQNTAPTSFTLNSSTALTPGTDYVLMVDGFAGNFCNYTVTPLVGAQVATLSITSNTLCSGQSSTLTLSGVTSGSTYSWTASTAGAISGSTTNSFVTVTPTANTTYSVRVNQPNGCSIDTYTRTIIVNPIPSMTSANTTTVCSGTALNFGLSSNLSSNFSWIAANNANTTGESTSAVNSGTINNTITNTSTVTQSVIYSVTPTSTLGSCVGATQIVTVSVEPLPSPTISSTSTLCLGSSLTFTGTGANTYSWTTTGIGGLSSSSGSTVNATPTNTGSINYTVNVTSAVGCTNTAVKTITVNPNPSANAGSGGTLTCNTTSLSLSGSGGGSYSWTGPGITSGSNTATPSVNSPGTYSLVVTSTLGCSSPIATVSVSQNTVAPTVTSSVSAVLNCTLTSVNIVATTTTSPVSYTWTGTGITAGSGNSSATINQPGTFNYTVTNTSNGCKTTGTQIVTQNTVAPTVTVSPTQTITCAVPTVTITGSSTPSTCTPVWSGGVASGSTSYTATASAANNYTLTVTNPANGCTANSVVQVVPDLGFPDVSTPAISNSITCTQNTATVVITTTSTPVSYTWTGTGITSSSTTNSISVNTGGTYTLVVRNTSSGCTSTVTAFVPTNTTAPSPSASNSTTLTCATTTAALTGGPSSGVNYQWSGPGFSGGTTSQNAIATSAGTYTLLVTNPVNSCTAIATTAVTQNTTAPVPTASNSGTLTCSVSTVALTGGPASGVSYQWSGAGFSGGTSSQNAIATAPGTYTLKVTNSVNSCTAIATTVVTQNTTAPVPTASTSGTLTCAVSTVALTGGPASGVTYQWTGVGFSGGTTSQNAVATTPGTYTLTVTSTVNSCTAAATSAVTQNTTAPIPSASNSATLTCSTNTVALTGSPASGVTYSWSGPGFSGGTTSQNAIANSPGTYTLTVTSTVNSCTAVATTAVSQNTTAPTPVANTGNILTCSTLTTALTGSPASGVTYQWSGPGFVGGTTSQNAVTSVPGTYTLTVTSTVNSCTAAATSAVSQDTNTPVPFALNTTTLTCSTFTADLTGGPLTSGFTFQWSGAGFSGPTNTDNAIATAPGTYSVLVTNTANDCFATATVAVTQNTTAPSPTASNSSTLTCSTNTVSLTGGPSSGVTYSWSGPGFSGGTTSQNAVATTPGTYTLTVTSTVNSCTAAATTAVTQNTTAPIVTMPSTQTITCASPTVSLIGSANPSTCTPVWTGGVCAGATTFTGSACSPNTYTLTITNPLNGCTASGTVAAVASIGVPSVTASNSGSITCTNTTAQIVASTTMTPVSYAWTGPGVVTGATSSTGTVSVGGSYQCIVTNTLTGCASTITTIVPTNTTPVTASVAPTSSITCATTSLTLSASPTGAFSYSWAPASGLTGNSVATPTVNQGGTYSVTITNTVNGCFANANVTVPTNTTSPTAVIAVNSITTTCSVPNATLSVTATPTTGATYSWTAPGSGSLNTYTVSNPIASGSGVFTVVVTNTINGCSNAASQATVQIIPDAAIPTVSVSANSLTITCTNTTVTSALTSTNTISSYNWSPAPVSGGANPVFNTPGAYNATVTASNGCVTNVSINVALDNTIPTVTLTSATNNGTLTCLNTSISITPTVSPSSNVTYTWSPSAGIATSANQSSATFTAAGVYTLAITNTVNGCVSSATNTANSFTVIANNTPPTFTLGTAPSVTTTCAAPNATLSASSNADPTAVYTWTTPTSATLTGNPVNTAAAGIYTVAVTNTVNGCSSSAVSTNTVEVVVDAGIPSITLSANSLSITCSNPTPSVAVSTTATPVTYSWSPTTGIVAGTETTANPSFNAAGSYSVVVTNTNSGCATDITTNVVNVTLDNTIPVITLSSAINDGTITCTNTSVVVNPTVTPSSNLTYTWSPGTGMSTPVNQASATFTAAGIYTLAVTNTLTGCVSTSTNSANTFTVYINNTTPTITTTQTSTNSVIGCANPVVSFSTNVTATGSSLTYTWNPGGVNTSTIDISTAGVYDVTVMDAVSGCTASTQFTVDGNTTIPSADAGANASIACGSSSVALSGTSTSTNVSYAWTGPNTSSIISGSNTATPTVADTGAYVLTITDNLTGCQNTATVVVTQANVAASFTANPTTGISPLTVNFTDQSTGANTWNWNFGDTNSSTSQNPTNTFNSGTYTVTLTASTGSCVSTATLLIIVEDGLTLEIPNVFTPNGDNVNDIFTIKSTGVKEITLQIFNRWGQKLYEFAGSKASWDGITPNGEKAPEATYFFFVKATGFDDKVIEQNGTLNLFR